MAAEAEAAAGATRAGGREREEAEAQGMRAVNMNEQRPMSRGSEPR